LAKFAAMRRAVLRESIANESVDLNLSRSTVQLERLLQRAFQGALADLGIEEDFFFLI